MRVRAALSVLVLCLGAQPALQAVAAEKTPITAVAAFLKVPGVEGHNTDKAHVGWLPILTAKVNAPPPSPPSEPGAPKKPSPPKIEFYSFTKAGDASDQALCGLSGKILPQVTFEQTANTGVLLRLVYSNATVQHCQSGKTTSFDLTYEGVATSHS
ncbi:MAG TPA: hypothetical protein VGI10_12220 [Polyangiaceae bacterium]|jgi:hypothetical protein